MILDCSSSRNEQPVEQFDARRSGCTDDQFIQ